MSHKIECADHTPRHPLNSYDEWSPLREVIVGRAEQYIAHHIDVSFRLFHGFFENRALDDCYEAIEMRVLDELSEDLDCFVRALKAAGVSVLRPERLGAPVDIVSPYWRSQQTPALNVRDQTIILGECILETPPQMRARLMENQLLAPIFRSFERAGARRLAMPTPSLRDDSFDFGFFSSRLRSSAVDQGTAGRDLDILIDGAQFIRFGEDVLVNVSNKNHELALSWVEREFGNVFRFHVIRAKINNHIDSHFAPLRPGLLLCRTKQAREMLPEFLHGWDVVICPEASDQASQDAAGRVIASRFVDMNVLSLDESTVIVNALFPELIEVLERLRFTVIPVMLRHGRLFSGGFHCFTLDTNRESGLTHYR